jgi:hypothetical protein
MTISTHIDAEANLRTHNVTGRLTFGLLQETLQALYARDDLPVDMNTLWDLRHADPAAFTGEEIRQLAKLVSAHWGITGQAKAALVVSGDASFGLARMFELTVDARSESQVKVFRDLAEARRWLGAAEQEASG